LIQFNFIQLFIFYIDWNLLWFHVVIAFLHNLLIKTLLIEKEMWFAFIEFNQFSYSWTCEFAMLYFPAKIHPLSLGGIQQFRITKSKWKHRIKARKTNIRSKIWLVLYRILKFSFNSVRKYLWISSLSSWSIFT